jgi:PEP-CTERM/exosortase A-associated glycosyltransferase
LARGIPHHKVTVIPNAVDIDAFAPSGIPTPALRLTLGLGDSTVIGFIGSFYAYEGLDLLIEALPAIAAKTSDVRVLLVGGGPREAALREQVGRLGLEARVIFAGRVPHQDVPRYYDLIDILAYPRHSMRLTELVTPLKPLEAMAQGRVLVASDVGGHRELIHNGVTGVLFRAGNSKSLADAVTSLLNQRDRWPAMRDAGRHFVEAERNWGDSVARYREVYARLAVGERDVVAA